MSINIRFPNINGQTEAEQLAQVRSYLHQLVEQLNWAFSTLESGGSTSASTAGFQAEFGSQANPEGMIKEE